MASRFQRLVADILLWNCTQLKRNALAMLNSKSSIQSQPFSGALGCPNQVQIKLKLGTLDAMAANAFSLFADNAPSLSRSAPQAPRPMNKMF